MSEAHAKLSPSGSLRRIKCPGSLLAEEGKEEKSSVYAEEGSSAHALGESCLKAGLFEVPDKFLGYDHREDEEIEIRFPATEEMAEHVEEYLEEARELLKESDLQIVPGNNNPLILIERRVQMKGIHPEWAWGTLDLGIYNRAKKRAYVRDLKFGTTIVDVELDEKDYGDVEFNPQLMEYAYGFIIYLRDLGLEVEEVDIGIVQPRARHKDGHIRSVLLTTQEVMNFIYDVSKPSAEMALQPGAPLASGKWCQYCKAKKGCSEYSTEHNNIVQEGFGAVDVLDTSKPVVIELPSIAEMTPAQLGNCMDMIALLQEYDKELKKEAIRRLEIYGEDIPGWVPTLTNPRRKWKDGAEDTLEMILDEEDIYETTMRSPAQIQKKLGKRDRDKVNALIYKPKGVLTVAPAKTTTFIVKPKENLEEGFTATREES